MKFNCGKTSSERVQERENNWRLKQQKLKNWHRKFLWFPVSMHDGEGNETHDCRWLETVERKGHISLSWYGNHIWNWQYRPIRDSK